MKRRTWILAGLTLCLLFVAGCGAIPGDGTGLEGKWTGSLATLFAVTNFKLPVPVAPEAELLFDGGALTVTLKPDIPVVGWLLSVVVDGSYIQDNSTGLDKVTMSLGKASVKFLFFKIPLKDLALNVQSIYKVHEQNTLYLLPGYDKLPEALRAAFEASPEDIPWTGITVDGVTYTPLALSRET